MPKTYLKLLIATCALNSFAQNNTLTAGGDIKTSDGEINYSIGNVVYQSKSSTNFSTQEGLQHSYSIEQTLSNEKLLLGSNIDLSIYPNPTADILNLKIESSRETNFNYNIFNLQGKLLKTGKIEKENTRIDMIKYASSVYFLNINKEGETVKTFKIQKK